MSAGTVLGIGLSWSFVSSMHLDRRREEEGRRLSVVCISQLHIPVSEAVVITESD